MRGQVAGELKQADGTDGHERRYGVTACDKHAYNGVASPLVLVPFMLPLLPSFCSLCCFISPASPSEQAEHLLMLPGFLRFSRVSINW